MRLDVLRFLSQTVMSSVSKTRNWFRKFCLIDRAAVRLKG